MSALNDAVKISISNDVVQYASGVMNDHLALEKEVERVIKRVINENRNDATIRLFKDKGRRDDLLEELFCNGLDNDTPLDEQLDIIFKDEYCLAINFLTAWSIELRNYFAKEFVEPWLEHYGATLSGIDVYAFIGKYKSTPFGLHKDDEHTFLLGCGNNHKNIFIVDENKEDIISKKHSIDEIHQKSNKYQLGGGDFLFIPKGVYHILSSDNYTVMLGIAPYPTSEKTLFSRTAKRLESMAMSGAFNNEYGLDASVLRSLTSNLDAISSLYSTHMADCLAAEVKLIRSSKYLSGTPSYESKEFSDSSEFNVDSEFKIIKCDFKEESRIFANGLEFVIKNKIVASNITNYINSGDNFSVESINREVLSGSNLKFSRDLVCRLLESGVIKNV